MQVSKLYYEIEADTDICVLLLLFYTTRATEKVPKVNSIIHDRK